jgi:GAF domain-containing protein
MIAPLPLNEQARLEALYAYDILDTPVEAPFDLLAARVAAALDAPIAVIGFIDETRHWFKAKFGTKLTVNTREWATCAHTIYQAAPLVTPDVRLEPRFANMPPLEQASILAYAGAPIMNADGCAVGTVCVFDKKTRPFSQAQIQQLVVFAQEALALLEARVRTEGSVGIELVSQVLVGSQPSFGVQDQILERIRGLPKNAPNAWLERLGHDLMRLHLNSDKPETMQWQLWSMNPLEAAPRPMKSFDSAQTDFRIPAQTRVLMVSLEPIGATPIHPTRVIAILPLELQHN